ncbi:uncharacterized protein J4E84_004655 [Alternaria hordeiaustralica]|uniref:uncharacterized protein n=1 Tax=Alternaria hordeiaustralica TaxID=1187925 RepID=UPI0020C45DC2|nr:uncharacterized protein J4E84_004655 [Alternaria hordeiaustralica]KAI4688725.1 hypothetical protein J4E84_004655 [Alternaria hordeiaustralica]
MNGDKETNAGSFKDTSMCDEASSAPASWNSLPEELKLATLGHRLHINGNLTQLTHPIRATMAGYEALLLTSKEMNRLAKISWGENQFLLSWPSAGLQYPRPPTSLAEQIRNLTIEIFVDCRLGWKRMNEDKFPYSWDVLLDTEKSSRLRRATLKKLKGSENPAVAWQSEFPALKELTVEIILAGDLDGYHNDRNKIGRIHGCRDKEKIEEHFEGCRTYLSTRKLTVKVRGFKCGDYSTDGDAGPNTKACPNGCAERVATCFADLVEIKD